jgi:hypothetical protein
VEIGKGSAKISLSLPFPTTNKKISFFGNGKKVATQKAPFSTKKRLKKQKTKLYISHYPNI